MFCCFVPVFVRVFHHRAAKGLEVVQGEVATQPVAKICEMNAEVAVSDPPVAKVRKMNAEPRKMNANGEKVNAQGEISSGCKAHWRASWARQHQRTYLESPPLKGSKNPKRIGRGAPQFKPPSPVTQPKRGSYQLSFLHNRDVCARNQKLHSPAVFALPSAACKDPASQSDIGKALDISPPLQVTNGGAQAQLGPCQNLSNLTRRILHLQMLQHLQPNTCS